MILPQLECMHKPRVSAGRMVRLLRLEPYPLQGAWAIADQAAVSLGSFLSGIALARGLSANDYGVYSSLLAAMLFLHGIHSSIVSSPMTFHSAGAVHRLRARHATASLLITGVLLIPGSLTLLVATGLMAGGQLRVWAPAALAAWQLQETLRRNLMCSLDHRKALAGDAVSYLGQAALIWHGVWTGWVTLERAFLVMSATSAVAALIQAAQTRLSKIGLSEAVRYGKEYLQFGQWLLYSSLVSVFRIQAFFWVLAAFRGPAQAASLQAVINVLGFANPLFFGLNNALMPLVVSVQKESGPESAWRAANRLSMPVGVLLFTYLLAVSLFASPALSLLYGPHSPYADLVWPLRLAAAAYALQFLAHLKISVLINTGRPRAGFQVQSITALSSILVGLPLAASYGLAGACGGLLAVSTCQYAAACLLLRSVNLIPSQQSRPSKPAALTCECRPS